MSRHAVEWNSDSLPLGTEIGPWRVERLHRRGAYGTVYRVRSQEPGERGVYALKLAHFARDPRFEREGLLLSRLEHASVPKLRERGEWEHPSGELYPYVVMEWVEGVSLYEWLAGGRRSSRQVLRVLARLARALEATHRSEAVHRDVKGDNVLVNEAGGAWLVDFGVGKFKGAPPLTKEMMPPGTYGYRSPQALRFMRENYGDRGARYEVTEADDVYALGVAAYRAVTGRYPPPGTDMGKAFEANRPPLPPLQLPSERATVSPELEALILRMLVDAPKDRGSAGEVAQALEKAADSSGRKADAPIILGRRGTAAEKRAHWARRVRQGLVQAAPWFGGAMGGVVLTALAWWMAHAREALPRAGQHVRVAKGEGEGPVALGDSGPLVPAATSTRRAQPTGIGLEMPKRPFPGQELPPCKKDFEVEIELTPGTKATRSCWVRIYASAEKCKANGYEYRGGCYLPVYPPAKLPQSVQQ